MEPTQVLAETGIATALIGTAWMWIGSAKVPNFDAQPFFQDGKKELADLSDQARRVGLGAYTEARRRAIEQDADQQRDEDNRRQSDARQSAFMADWRGRARWHTWGMFLVLAASIQQGVGLLLA